MFRRVWLGQAISGVGDGVFPVALALAVLREGRGPVALGVVLTADAVGAALGALGGGVAADRLGRVQVMVGADLLRLAAVLGFAAAYRSAFVIAACCAALVGLGGSVFSPAYFGLVPQLVGKEDLQAANGLRSATNRATRLIGPLLGGFIAATFSLRAAFLFDAATFAVSVITLTGAGRAGSKPASPDEGILDTWQTTDGYSPSKGSGR